MTIIVVLTTALAVISNDWFIASSFSKPLFILNLYELKICIESSTINPKTIAKINALDKLK